MKFHLFIFLFLLTICLLDVKLVIDAEDGIKITHGKHETLCSAGLKLDQRSRRCASIKSTLGQRFIFAVYVNGRVQGRIWSASRWICQKSLIETALLIGRDASRPSSFTWPMKNTFPLWKLQSTVENAHPSSVIEGFVAFVLLITILIRLVLFK